MPPQQRQRFSDIVDDRLYLGAHQGGSLVLLSVQV